MCYSYDVTRFYDGNLFRAHNLACLYPSSPRSAPCISFHRDCFQYSLFGLKMLPMRFRTILIWQLFLRIQSPTLISHPIWERTFDNFRALPLPIFVIWPKHATSAISYDSKMATFFARPIAHANIPAVSVVLLLYCSRATASIVRYFARICYPCDFA